MTTNETGGGHFAGNLLAFFALSAVSQDELLTGRIIGKRPITNCKITPGAGRASHFIGTVGGTQCRGAAWEYLTNAEVDRLIKAAGANRNRHRTPAAASIGPRRIAEAILLLAVPLCSIASEGSPVNHDSIVRKVAPQQISPRRTKLVLQISAFRWPSVRLPH